MVEQMAETLIEECETEEQMISSENDVVASVSFGRFENDLLSWERWSSFSQNKYLEEVEKCSTPGSVARKKAYFEAHYKKIAARKAELMEQEQQLEADTLRSNYPSSGNRTRNDSNFELDLGHIDEPNRDVVGVDCQDSFGQGIKEETDSQQESPSTEKSKLAVKKENPLEESQALSEEFSLSIKEDNCSIGSPAEVEELPIFIREENQSTGTQSQLDLLPDLVKEEKICTGSPARIEEVNILIKEEIDSSGSQPQTSTDHANKAENTKLKPRKESQKIAQRTPASKEKTLVKTKKKPVTPNTKPAQNSVSRASKPSTASTVISTSRISTRKESSPSLLRNKNISAAESKRSTSNSLHMSLNVPPTKSDSSFQNTTRRSFIMEKMGDKEIVKKAFRAFQNTYNPSKAYVSSAPQQVSKKEPERITSSMTPRKDKERTGTALGKASPQRKQVGTRSNSLSTGPVKAASVNQTSIKTAPSSSFGLGSDGRVEKRREFLMKLDEKSKAREVESTRLRSKSKVPLISLTCHSENSSRTVQIMESVMDPSLGGDSIFNAWSKDVEPALIDEMQIGWMYSHHRKPVWLKFLV
ncbi:hypothetical protein BVC80_9023g29 [Macleaya cordata]|uniref:TPX2 C-terminal domain-containing protein n=1 Tax=Macleaya cordata TaxID=56857 RepID=A0A200QV32_MACCD|nr:hypothetical protein BVC80_9023g29 [Macleaya cordata]